MPYKIRPIDLIKYNPSLFHVWIYDPMAIYQILGGAKFFATVATGAFFGNWYFTQKMKYNPQTYYVRIMMRSSRLFVGAVAGAAIGWLKFADRQRLHNAWVAERLIRRYPEGRDLATKDLWKYKGTKPSHEFYKWV